MHVRTLLAGFALAIVLVSPASEARRGGHHYAPHYYDSYYGGYRGGYYGGYRGGYYGGYRGSYYGGYRGSHYAGSRHAYRGHYAYSGHATPGVLYRILTAPARVVGALVGYDATHGNAPSVDTVDAREFTSRDERTLAPRMGPAVDAGSVESRAPAAAGDPAPTTGAGWHALAAGDHRSALAAFAVESQHRPRAGTPKVGYALAAAAGGDLARGIWAMRRAARIDPDALHYLTLDDALAQQVLGLRGRYQAQPATSETRFMLAALGYLLGDRVQARAELEQAIAAGDQQPSTRSLSRMLDVARTASGIDVVMARTPAPVIE